MTQNQIAYWKLQEDIRSNKRNEELKQQIQESQIQKNDADILASYLSSGINIVKGIGAIAALL